VFLQPELDEFSPWLGHVPFAFWLVEALAPRTIVELGTQAGVSYCAFCQAVVHLELPTACWAVDTWKGEAHTGFYGEEVFGTLRAHHDQKYSAFSRLVRSTFEEALPHFTDASIDLLHIDGLHTYEAVSADFHSWLPKLSDRAVVVFHDINVRERGFGVSHLWHELSQRYPAFSFLHSHGLGVLAVGSSIPSRLRWLIESNGGQAADVRTFFERLGDRLVVRFERETLLRENSHLNAVVAELGEAAPRPGQASSNAGGHTGPDSAADVDDMPAASIAALRVLATRRSEQLERLHAISDERCRQLEAKISRAHREAAMLADELLRQRRQDPTSALVMRQGAEPAQAVALADARYSAIVNSTSWRLTRPLRAAARLQRAARQRDWRAIYHWRETIRGLPPPTAVVPAASAIAGQPEPQPGEPRAAPSAVLSRTGRPLIAFVSGYPGSPSETYRVVNPTEVLAEFFDILPLTEAQLSTHRERIEAEAAILVLFRLGLDETVFNVIQRARANGCVVVYDVDDLVFDEAIAAPRFVDGMWKLPAEQLPAYRSSIAFAAKLIGAVDVCTMPTAYLVDRVAARGATALLLPSGMNVSMLNWFDRAWKDAVRPVDGKLRIGYASGTSTHRRDFAVVTDALLQILTTRSDVLLTVIGALDLGEYPDLAALEHKIERRALVPHVDLPMELMRLDINIAPLEVGNPFCEAKSELKYFDAAFLEIPTVASPVAGYSAAITPGVTGFLANDTREWVTHLEALLDDHRLRVRIGKQARGDALRRFGPGAVRENTKRVYQELLAMRREVTPPRYKGYDNFLYAINYPPAARARGGAINTIRDGRLTLHWIVPVFSAGAGGISNILRVIQHLEVSGHRNTLWVHSPWDMTDAWKTGLSASYKRLINDDFRHILAEVHPLGDLDQIQGDAVVATDHYSAYPARAVRHIRRRFYFLQDNEAEFSPTGYATLFADATLDFGFDAISNGAWLHEMATRRGMWSIQWDQAADPQHYFDVSLPRKPGHIAFYARLQTPRRAVELGMLAFELLARWGMAFHVEFFGGEIDTHGLPYPSTNHGVLSAHQLGQLYQSASIGMVFSSTNYSIIPREMMACGLPVVEIACPSTRISFSEAAAVLSEPTPQSVARHLRTLLLDPVRREQIAGHGRAAAAQFSWERSSSEIEAAMLSRLGGAAASPPST